MSEKIEVSPNNERELVLARLLAASPNKVFRCWTEPQLITQWFTPPPWRTIKAELDVRAGGSSLIVMQGPDGAQAPNRGVYLEVQKDRRLVFTDAFQDAWTPSGNAFMTVDLSFEAAAGGSTRYIARALHWTLDDKSKHEAMGFHTGWGVAADQLEALAQTL